MSTFDVRVRGAGIVGKSLALALARCDLRVVLDRAAASPARADVRAYAINAGSIALLRSLKVWEAIAADAKTPVHDMRVQGDAPRATVEFSAWQQRVGELAVIVDAGALEGALDEAIRYAPKIDATADPADGDDAIAAALVAHCEGRGAKAALAALGAGIEHDDYAQRAIAARLVATRRHRHVARQWFRSPDVLALLPFDRPEPDRSYALVWSLPTARADALVALDDATFAREVEQVAGGATGELALASARAAWPLVSGGARHWCGPGWVLVGDAAHVVHPLAGQGLNLGFADVAALAETLAEREPWRGLGDERLLRRYVRRRAAPTWAMLRTIDGLQRLFAASEAPISQLRNNGMATLDRIAPLKRWLAARAIDS